MSDDFMLVCSSFGVVIIVMVIIVIIALSVSGSSTWTGKCSSHSNCKASELCSANGLCKSGVGVSCQSNGDCFSGICVKGSCVAPSEPVPTQTVSKTGKITITGTSNVKSTLTNISNYSESKDTEPTTVPPKPLDYISLKTVPHADISSTKSAKRNFPTIRQEYDLSIKSPSGPFSYLDDYCVQEDLSDSTGSPGSRVPGLISSDSEEDFSSEEDNGHQPLLYTTDPFQEGSSGSFCPVENSGIIDLLVFNGSIVYLQTDGSIRRDSTKIKVYIKPRTKTKLESIVVYNGHLLGLADGKIYELQMCTFNDTNWFFNLLDGNENCIVPRINYATPIIRMGTTLDHDYLILQYGDRLKIYSSNLYEQKTFPLTIKDFSPMRKRIYGENLSVYVDVDKSKMIAIDSNGGKFSNVVDALINNYGNTVILTTFRSMNGQLTGIRLINNKIYYISSLG